jgi:hypothetical protein
MLVVVSTEYLALRLSERLKGSPTFHTDVTQKLGNYMSWDYRRYVQTKIEREDPEKAARARKRNAPKREKRKLTEVERKRERALYQAAYRAKQDGDMETYEKLEAERDALRFVTPK